MRFSHIVGTPSFVLGLQVFDRSHSAVWDSEDAHTYNPYGTDPSSSEVALNGHENHIRYVTSSLVRDLLSERTP